MKYRVSLVVAMISVAALLPVSAQDDFSDVEITTTKLADGVYMLQGAGGNIGVSAGEDGVILIDDQFAPLTEKILAAVRAIDDGPIRFVLNTHWHGDHTGGNENLGEAGAVIVAHDNARTRMTTGAFNELWDRQMDASPEGGLPVVTFSDELTFHFNGGEIHAFHVEHAHTAGDSIVHFRADDVIHMGDIFFNGTFPFIDVYSGGSLAGVIAACNAALEISGPETSIIPGHGPLAGRADLQAYRNMLLAAHDAVAPLFRAGMTREEIAAANPLEPLVEKWGQGWITPEQFLELIYEGMERHAGS